MTEPLLPRDPVRIGGHRLLARLGAGGMGVVYLGRSHTGGLAAVKVVHPELAADPDFRARFRREVEAARRVNSPWATPVTDAGPDEATRWLATAFVPGPSLSDAVRRFGPLPTGSVRSLGRMLAAALREVHAAGIVHRDVKPGNVLLAVDGPRLIDFGIARSADQTAITSAGVVAGSPGFLSPEQAEARTDELGPACDVFSLGCLLAYAATGRAPFGGGTIEAVLYRTVHDEPDLAGIGSDPRDADGAELLALLRACMAKNPSERPSAAQVESRLAEAAPASRPWLPEDVVRDIAGRSAQMLALPDVVPTVVDGTGAESRARPSRRRLLGMASGAAVLAAAGGGTALWASTGEKEPGGERRRWALGVHADLSGPGKVIGRALEQGARLAVEQYDARRNKPFELGLRTADDEGSAERTKSAAERLVRDRDVLAVLGPNTTASGVPAVGTYDEAMLPVLFVVPGSLDLMGVPCRSALHCRASDSSLAYWLAAHLARESGTSRIGLLQDRTARSYSFATATSCNVALRDARTELYPRVVPSGIEDYGPTVEDIVRADVDAFVYAGYAGRAALVARELAAAGFDGPRTGTQALSDPVFLELAGDAAEGWGIATSFIDPSAEPKAESFRKAFRNRFGSDPDYYAAEAYDVANLTIRELTGATESGRPPSRERLVSLLRRSRYRGIAKQYAFDAENGRFAGTDTFLYRVEGGELRFRAPVSPGK